MPPNFVLKFKNWLGRPRRVRPGAQEGPKEFFTHADANRIKDNANAIAGMTNRPTRAYVEMARRDMPDADEFNKLESHTGEIATATGTTLPIVPETNWGPFRNIAYGDFNRMERNLFAIYEAHGGSGIPYDSDKVATVRLYASEWDEKGGAPLKKDFGYTGKVESIILKAGIYLLEAWGADGGDVLDDGTKGGKGGYSKGKVFLEKDTTIFLAIGQRGMDSIWSSTGGFSAFNGGGEKGLMYITGAGGGATSFALISGTIQNITVLNKSKILLIAGGGGGAAGIYGKGGDGGGLEGESGLHNNVAGTEVGNGATQTAGGVGRDSGKFGLGGGRSGFNVGSGGGGLYGGGAAAATATSSAGGGGSGYIDNVYDGVTLKIKDQGYVQNPDADGNGYARITEVRVEHEWTQTVLCPIATPDMNGRASFSTWLDQQTFNKGRSAAPFINSVEDGKITVAIYGSKPIKDVNIEVHRVDDVIVRSANLTVAGWVEQPDGTYNQTLTVADINTTSEGIAGISMSATKEEFIAAQMSIIRVSNQSMNQITFTAVSKPSVNIPIEIQIQTVEA